MKLFASALTMALGSEVQVLPMSIDSGYLAAIAVVKKDRVYVGNVQIKQTEDQHFCMIYDMLDVQAQKRHKYIHRVPWQLGREIENVLTVIYKALQEERKRCFSAEVKS